MNFFRRTAASAASPVPEPLGLASGTGGIPLELVSYDQNTGRFEVGAAALAALRKIRTPIGVVAVSGRARQGKSFILNQLLGASGGFKVGPTVRPCTKGLWMWSAPVKRRAPNGDIYHLALLDTEGIDAFDQTGQYSTQIFSLAVLLSSLFVYNQMGGIDESALDRLSLVTEMTKHIRVRANEVESEESELASFTPAFLWLLRDFYLRLEDNGRKVTARDYLETALAPLPGHGASVDAKNAIRESIKGLFPERDCFTLVRPVNNEEELTKLEELPQSQMRPEFREGLKQLTQLILSKAQPKRLGTQVVTGPVLAALTEAYVAAINNGAVPTIATAWQGVAEAECRRAADSALATYNAAFDQSVTAEEAALDGEQSRCVQLALQTYDDSAVGHEAPREANRQRLLDSMAAQYGTFKAKRLAEAALACEKMLRDASEELAQIARTSGATVQQLEAALKSFQQRYIAQAHGPNKLEGLNSFLTGTYARLVDDVHQRQQRELEERNRAIEAQRVAEHAKAVQLQAAQSALETRALAAESRADAATARVAVLEQQLREAQRNVEEAAQQLQLERASKADAVAETQRAREQVQAQAQEKGTISGLQQQIRQLQSELELERAKLTSALASQHSAERRATAAEAGQATLRQQMTTLQQQQNQPQIGRQQPQQATRHKAVQDGPPSLSPAQQEPVPSAVHTGDVNMEEAAAADDGESTNDPASMTIPQIKAWLTDNGHEAAAWELVKNKKAKKADWVKLMQEKLMA